jgi:hypothetical protein
VLDCAGGVFTHVMSIVISCKTNVEKKGVPASELLEIA